MFTSEVLNSQMKLTFLEHKFKTVNANLNAYLKLKCPEQYAIQQDLTKRIREKMLSLSGTRRGDHNCPSHVNRPCSNRTLKFQYPKRK